MKYNQIILDTMYSANYKPSTIDQLKESMYIGDNEEYSEFVKSLVELEENYEIARDEKDKYRLASDLGIFTGSFKYNQKGFGFVDSAEFSAFVPLKNMNYALDKDEVVARITNKEEMECEIVKIIKHANELIVGTIKIKDNKRYFLSDKEFKDRKFSISNIREIKAYSDIKVLVRVDSFSKTIKGEIVKVIGYKSDPGVDITSVLYEHNIKCEFDEETLDEAMNVNETISKKDYENRTDFTNDMVITIDGDDAKDLDDAISVEKIQHGYRLSVHIADVSHYVQANTAIDNEAFTRGTSVYVTDRVVPMLPHLLSNGICSLNPNVERLTMSCIMDINVIGDIMDYKIVQGVIKSKYRMTYNKVNQILAKDDESMKEYQPIVAMIDDMKKLSKIIRKRREDLGAIDFDKKENKIIVDDKGKPVDVVLRTRGESERIIEDFMIAANECVATHMKWQEIACLYRVHEHPNPKKIKEFIKTAKILGYNFKGNINSLRPKQCQQMLIQAKGKDEYQVLSTFLLRCMAKARYDGNCLGHFGLALENYLHFTSPIRRYPDLLVHRMIRKYCIEQCIDENDIRNDDEYIEQAAIQSSEKERCAVDAEREVNDMKSAEYMSKFIGHQFYGIISSITKFGMFIELDNAIEGLVHVSNMNNDHYKYEENARTLIGERTGKVYKIGQKVKVEVLGANKFKREIDFIIVRG